MKISSFVKITYFGICEIFWEGAKLKEGLIKFFPSKKGGSNKRGVVFRGRT